jgi:iron(III) transport system permease protein
LGLLLLFILYPLLRVFGKALDRENWRQVLSSSRWLESLGHTLLLTLLSTFLSVLTGLVYAYALGRGDIPFVKFFSFIPVLHLVTPPFVGGLSFILLFGRQGFFTRTLLGLDISLYGLPGLLIAQTLCFFPIAYLIIKDTLEEISPSLEYAARSAGAGRLRVLCTVTIPLALPGIVSALLFIGLSVLSDFGNPILIGGRFNVLAVDLYTQLTGWANQGSSAVLGLILLCPAAILFVLQRYSLYRRSSAENSGAQNSRFATVGGRASDLPHPLLPMPVRVLLFLFCALIALVVVAQFLAVILGAFSQVWGVDPAFTLRHFRDSFYYRTELGNTLRFALTAAFVTAILGTLVALISLRTNLPFRKIADTVVMLPASMPGSLFGLAYILAFTQGSLRLTGTKTIIVAVMVACDIPAAYRIISSALMGIRSSIDEAARSLGASQLRLFVTVLCPLLTRAIASAFVYTFVRASGTLSAVIFLISFKTKLTSALILNLAGQGDWGKAAALAIILTAGIFASLGILRFLAGRPVLGQLLTGERGS